MKIQIRRGVFETNSSSTHSLQILPQTIEQAREHVYDMIKESYGNDDYDRLNISDFLIPNYDKGNTFNFKLNGFEIEDGDEYHNEYCIISNWVYKFQYLIMLYNYYACNFEDYTLSTDIDNPQPDEYYNKLRNLKEYDYLCGKIKDIGAKNGYNITNISADFSKDTYIETIKPKDYFKLETEGKVTYNDWKEFVDMVMDDNYTIIYADEAYRPYGSPNIVVY